MSREHATELFKLFHPSGRNGKAVGFSLDGQQRAEAAMSDLLVRACVDLDETEWDALCGALSETLAAVTAPQLEGE